MVKLRLKRIGKRHYPVYKIVAADSRSPRDGRFIESVGTYNPNIDPMEIKLNEGRVRYWLKVGALPTDTVRSLLKREGLILKLHLEKKGAAQETIEAELQKFMSQKESKLIRAKEKRNRRKQNKKASKETKEAAGTGAGEQKPE